MGLIDRILQSKLRLKETILQGIKFSIVGVLNTFVGWASFFILFYFLKIDFRVANILSYILGITNSFLFNKLWTFKSRRYRFSEVFFFVLVFLISFSIQYFFTLFLKERLRVNPFLAYIAGNIVYTLIGFIGNKFITFHKV